MCSVKIYSEIKKKWFNKVCLHKFTTNENIQFYKTSNYFIGRERLGIFF
jgi:hypothetical protein